MPSAVFKADAAEIERKLRSTNPRLVDLHPNGTLCRLIRLSDNHYAWLRENYFPIQADFGFSYAMLRRKESTLNLAQTFVVLEALFGETSRDYDDYKSSFEFPLFLHLQKSSGSYPYVFKVLDYKGSLEFNLYRIIDGEDQTCRAAYQKPRSAEFSSDEIEFFYNYFFGFLEGYFSTACSTIIRPFFRTMDSCWGIYGCKNGKYFEKYYATEKTYTAAINRLAATNSARSEPAAR